MVVVEKEGETTFYIENKLKKNLDNIKKKINTKDRDYVLIVDGEEGAGMSSLAIQFAKLIDPLNQSSLCKSVTT